MSNLDAVLLIVPLEDEFTLANHSSLQSKRDASTVHIKITNINGESDKGLETCGSYIPHTGFRTIFSPIPPKGSQMLQFDLHKSFWTCSF